MELTLAYSPCPNDTFMFHDIATGRLHLDGATVTTHLHDVQTLNEKARDGLFDITKLSFHAWLLVRSEYSMLNVGAALGYGCGPVVVARQPMDKAALADCRVAIPGELTTAHLLLRLWQREIGEAQFVRYDEVIPMVADGRVDAGVIIHEGRFVYPQAGLHLVTDLGQWWEQETSLPIPLGCIAARTSLGADTIGRFEAMLAQSIRNSVADPDSAREYVSRYASEMDEAVLSKHIRTFVNDYSLDLGPDGRAAVAALERRAVDAGIIS